MPLVRCKHAVYQGLQQNLLFDPVCSHNTENVEREFNGDKLSSRSVGGSLGGPNGCDGIQNTRADTVQDTGAEHPVGILSRTLQGCADDGPNGG